MSTPAEEAAVVLVQSCRDLYMRHLGVQFETADRIVAESLDLMRLSLESAVVVTPDAPPDELLDRMARAATVISVKTEGGGRQPKGEWVKAPWPGDVNAQPPLDGDEVIMDGVRWRLVSVYDPHGRTGVPQRFVPAVKVTGPTDELLDRMTRAATVIGMEIADLRDDL